MVAEGESIMAGKAADSWSQKQRGHLFVCMFETKSWNKKRGQAANPQSLLRPPVMFHVQNVP